MTTLLFVLAIFAAKFANGDWEVGVASGGSVYLLEGDGGLAAEVHAGGTRPRALAIDPFGPHLIFSDVSHPNASIFWVGLNSNSRVQPLVAKESRFVQGLGYDPVENQIFWTTGLDRKIMVASVGQGLARGHVLHEFKEELPQGLAVDPCNRKLYWTNSNMILPTIEQSSLDGSNRAVVINENLFQPLGLTLSLSDEMLYWVDERPGHWFSIERARVDGSERQVILLEQHQQPHSVAVTSSRVYWTDWMYKAVWNLELKASPPQANILRSFKKPLAFTPEGIVTLAQYANLDDEKCKPLQAAKNRTDTLRQEMDCTNGGEKTESGCACRPGFEGELCESSVCHNYCLAGGSCSVSESGLAHCDCPEGYEGSRCEISHCPCLNEGTCFNSTCVCLPGFTGNVCQFETSICLALCSVQRQQYLNVCRCDQIHSRLEASGQIGAENWVDRIQLWRGLTAGLGVACAILSLVVVLLAAKALSLRRRPRLRRRYKLAPPPRPPTHCEIAIENCCNMNICETPCYEPEFRTVNVQNDAKKKEEKKNLLGNIEVQPDSDLY